jgi:hypothetical protein
MTPLAAGAEPIIVKQILLLADRVIGDVFESFAPRPPSDTRYYTPSIPASPNVKK